MATKSFFRNFEDFRGLDLFSSHLSRKFDFAQLFRNCEITKRKAVTKRKGFKPCAQWDLANVYYPCNGLWEYRYFHPAATTEQIELVSMGSALTTGELFTLREGTFVIDGPANSTFSFLPSATNGHYYFDCLISGVSVGGAFPYDCGVGNAANTPTLAQLKTQIEGLGGGGVWTVTLTPSGVVSGNQVARDHANPVTVAAGHTLTANILPGQYRRYEIEVPIVPGTGRAFHDCIEVSGNNIRFKPISGTFDVVDGAQIGIGMYPAIILPITEATSCAAPATVNLTFWEEVYRRDAVHCDIRHYATYQVSSKQAAYNIFFSSENVNIAESTLAPADISGMAKYDGKELYAAGLPSYPTFTAAAAAGAGLSVGRYKYLAEFVRIDEVGNEVHGNASDIIDEVTVTTTGGNQQVTLTLSNLPYASGMGFGQHSAFISGAHGPATHIHVTAATNTLRIGDWVYLKDSALGTFVLRQVISMTDTQVNFSATSTPVTVTNAVSALGNRQDLVSNILINVYRTKVGGTYHYLLKGFPNDESAATTAWVDATADTALGEQWEGPFLGQDRRDMPPNSPLLENHQGLLVSIGGADAPSRLRWSSFESPEYWSGSTNYQDILASEGGRFTGIVSSSIDTLVLFKENSYKPISGDIYSGNFSLTAEPQMDLGCPSFRGMVNCNGGIFFLTKGGPRLLSGDAIVEQDKRLVEVFYEGISVSQWCCGADIYNHRIFFIPGTGSELYSYDYLNDTWQSLYTTLCSYFSAMTESQNDLYFLGGTSATQNILFKQNRTDTKYDYVDAGGLAIDMDCEPQWDFVDEPCLDKEFIRTILYSLNPALAAMAFTLQVQTYRNFKTATADSDLTVSFDGTTDIDKQVDFVLNRAKALMIRFRNNVLLECPTLTGYEVEIALPYKKEHLALKAS